MITEVNERINGLENILHGMQHNQQLLEFLSFDLHSEPINTTNNLGLFWIWKNTFAIQILDFYKIIGKDEKHSFTKIINILKAKKIKIDYRTLEAKIDKLIKEYNNAEIGEVRSKFLAHQDVNTKPIKTDILTIKKVQGKANLIFRQLSKELKYKPTKMNSTVLTSFKEIFKTLDEYEKVKAFLLSYQLNGKNNVSIPELVNAIKN